MGAAFLFEALRCEASIVYSRILLSALFLAGAVQAQGVLPEHRIPVEITPEAVLALQSNGVAHILIDAQQVTRQAAPPAKDVRLVYFTMGPSSRAAHEAVLRDRKASTPRESSQRLVGTPLDWSRLGLLFSDGNSPKIEHPTVISTKDLSDAIKDGADLQLVDLRPASPPSSLPNLAPTVTATPPSLPGATNLLPHQLDAELPKFSKSRWIVLIDDGNRVALPIAERIFQKGYTLVCILDGGYPAWVSATNR